MHRYALLVWLAALLALGPIVAAAQPATVVVFAAARQQPLELARDGEAAEAAAEDEDPRHATTAMPGSV